jgi:hypothetical protein
MLLAAVQEELDCTDNSAMFRWPLLLIVALAVIAGLAAFLLSGRGSEQRLVPFAVFRNVSLDTPQSTIERQFGKPLRSAPGGALDPGTTCLFYHAPADAAPATEYQFCFLRSKLHSKFAG